MLFRNQTYLFAWTQRDRSCARVRIRIDRNRAKSVRALSYANGREVLADLLSRARENEAPARYALTKEEFRVNKIYQALFSNIE